MAKYPHLTTARSRPPAPPTTPERGGDRDRAQPAAARHSTLCASPRPEFTSACAPVTGQPDFAHLVIDYAPRARLVESKSLKLYPRQLPQPQRPSTRIAPWASASGWWELKPRWLRIGGYWYPRGGMPIDVFWQTGAAAQGPVACPITGVRVRTADGADGQARRPVPKRPPQGGDAGGELREAIAERGPATSGFDAVGLLSGAAQSPEARAAAARSGSAHVRGPAA